MTKQSKTKGLVFLPKCVQHDCKVQQLLHATQPKRHGGRKSIKLEEISPTIRERVFNRPSSLKYVPLTSKTL